MKEVQFKSGGRRLRIEDLSEIQNTALSSAAWLPSDKSFVLSGCELTLVGTPLSNPSYNHTNPLSTKFKQYKLMCNDGLVWLNNKIRHITNSGSSITYTGGSLYIVEDDVLDDSPITYYDGTTAPQFHVYGAKIIVANTTPDTPYISLLTDISLNEAKSQWSFHNVHTGWLSNVYMPRSGGDFNPSAETTWTKQMADGLNLLRLSAENGVYAASNKDGDNYSNVTLSPNSLFFRWILNGEQTHCGINATSLFHKTICAKQFGNEEQTAFVQSQDVINLLNTIKSQANVIKFINNPNGTAISEDRIETKYFACEKMITGTDDGVERIILPSKIVVEPQLEPYLQKVEADAKYLGLSKAEQDFLTKDTASTIYLSKSDADKTFLKMSEAVQNYLTNDTAESRYLKISDSSQFLKESTATLSFMPKADIVRDYLTKESAAGTYLTQTNASGTYLAKDDAASTYLSKSDANKDFLTKTSASGTYITKESAASTYLTQANATGTYLTQANATGTYLSKEAAASTYLSKSDANKDFLTKTSASDAYLTKESAAGTYLTQTNASGTYLSINNANKDFLTKTNATELYLTKDSASSLYLTTNNAAATYLTMNSAASTYLSKNDAASIYTTKSQLTDYIKSSELDTKMNQYLQRNEYLTEQDIEDFQNHNINTVNLDASNLRSDNIKAGSIVFGQDGSTFVMKLDSSGIRTQQNIQGGRISCDDVVSDHGYAVYQYGKVSWGATGTFSFNVGTTTRELDIIGGIIVAIR